MYRITEPFFKCSTFSWDFLVQHVIVLPIFDDVFDIWFISMPQTVLLKRAWKLCTSEFLLFDGTKFKAARFHSLLIGWKGHVTCIHQSEQYAIFSELAGANLRRLWLVHKGAIVSQGTLGFEIWNSVFLFVYLKRVVSEG